MSARRNQEAFEKVFYIIRENFKSTACWRKKKNIP